MSAATEPTAPRWDAMLRAVMLGVAMREAQRRYFADRTPENLSRSKRLEREFDQAAEGALRGDTLL